jgi:hypothetical protein
MKKREREKMAGWAMGFVELASEEWVWGGALGEAVVPLQDHIAACRRRSDGSTGTAIDG